MNGPMNGPINVPYECHGVNMSPQPNTYFFYVLVLKLSETHFVSQIRHQPHCNRQNFDKAVTFLLQIHPFSLVQTQFSLKYDLSFSKMGYPSHVIGKISKFFLRKIFFPGIPRKAYAFCGRTTQLPHRYRSSFD